MNKIDYTEISRAKISESRNLIISYCSKGGFTVAQQLVAKDGDKTTSVFLKGAFHVDGVEGLYEIRDAINYAINEAQEGKLKDTTRWD